MRNVMLGLIVLSIFVMGLSGCGLFNREIVLTDARMVTGVNEKLMPVEVKDVFLVGTSKVSCWFKWRDAKINLPILAKWHYVTDDIHILDYKFDIPKKDGMGSVALTMPEGKTLPVGSYKIDLLSNGKLLKSLTFRVEE